MSVSVTESDIFTVLRQWLLSIFPAGTVVMQGQQNQTASPLGPFALMTIITRERLATNGWNYADATRDVTEQTQFSVQVSTFGKGAGNMIQSAVTLWRDSYAVEFFRASGKPIAPLYASNPRQLGFINAENQYEDNWSADFQLQANITVSVPQQYATSATIALIEAETLTEKKHDTFNQ